MQKIASFTIDHIKLQPGLYVSRKDNLDTDVITTFDLRMTSPNEEPVMNTAEVHTIEHLGATFLRNHHIYGNKTIYFGPMGCRTGFYFIVRNKITPLQAIKLTRDALSFCAEFSGEVPGVSAKECGNWRDHDLEGAKKEAAAMLTVLEKWEEKDLVYPVR